MSDLLDQKLSAWVKKICGDITEEGQFSHVEMIKIIDGKTEPEPIESFDLTEDVRANPDSLSQAITDAANEEASTCQGMFQRFLLLAFMPGKETYSSRFPFMAQQGNPKNPYGVTGEDSTPANESGLFANMLRHDTENHRLMLLQGNSYAQRAESTINRLSMENERLAESRMRVLIMQEQLMDQKMSRDLQYAVELQKAKRNDEMKGMVLNFLPLLFAKATGGKNIGATPMAAMARDMAIGKILKGLSQEEIAKVVGALKNENKIAFWELYSSYGDDDARDQAGKPEVMRDEPVEGARH